MKRSNLVLIGSLILAIAGLIHSVGLPAPPVATTLIERTIAVAPVVDPSALVATPAAPEDGGVRDAIPDAPDAEIGRRPVVPPTIDLLIANLAEACRTGQADAIPQILGEIREILAVSDAAAERTFARAVVAGGPGAKKLHHLALTYPNYERRRTLRSRLTEAAPPAPAAHPNIDDAGAVAAYLGASHPSDEKLQLLERLSPEVLRSPAVRDRLVDVVLRSPRGGAMAAASLRLLRGGPREETERIAMRVLEEATATDLRITAVRILGAVAGETGTARLVEVVRDSAAIAERRLAADALNLRPLDAVAIEVLGNVAEDCLEDYHLRGHAISALFAEFKRGSPASGLARDALRRIVSATGPRIGSGALTSGTVSLIEDVVLR